MAASPFQHMARDSAAETGHRDVLVRDTGPGANAT
jgi:hypothetical protein